MKSYFKQRQEYYPQSGSAAEVMVTWLKLTGSRLSSAELGQVADVPGCQVMSILEWPLKNGLVERAKVLGRLEWWYAGSTASADVDDETCTRIVQRQVPARQALPLVCRAPISVFDFGRFLHEQA